MTTLEDPEQRARLIASLRSLALAQAQEPKTGPSVTEIAAVKTAATELVQLASEKVETLARSATLLADTLRQLPQMLAAGAAQLSQPATRQRWLPIGGQLLAVLGAGFVAAALVGLAIHRLRRRKTPEPDLSLPRRALRLLLYLAVDLVPIAAFAVAAYGALTVIDPRQEFRLVAVALIYASILSRLVQAVSAFAFAPRYPELRLSKLGDEPARYIHQWIRRLSVIGIYGFFGLQASVLLGLDATSYHALFRLLGLVILALLLILVVRNRRKVAEAIAAEPAVGADELRQLSSLRKGVARVWHLLAGIYLIAVFVVWTRKAPTSSCAQP
ncbi:MAG: hypothetical protein P8106_12220 [Gammaproteobacteria bacterium]